MVSGTRPTRADYYNALASSLPTQALVVTSLGNASYLWAVVHHAPENFYIEDAMGLALPLALGLAISQPKRPGIVVEGDGALLMHMGALVTVGAVKAANLTVLLVNPRVAPADFRHRARRLLRPAVPRDQRRARRYAGRRRSPLYAARRQRGERGAT